MIPNRDNMLPETAKLPEATEQLVSCIERAEADLEYISRRLEEEFSEKYKNDIVRTQHTSFFLLLVCIL